MTLARRCIDQWPTILVVLGGLVATASAGAYLAMWVLAEMFRGALP